MNRFKPLARIRSTLSAWAEDQRGISAVEFALIAPLMVALYLGSAELGSALTTQRKVTQMATVMGDLVAQDDYLTEDEYEDIEFAALSALGTNAINPYTSRVSSVRLDDEDDGPYVDWNIAVNTSAYGADEVPDIPTGLLTEGGSIIMVEISYDHNSLFNAFIDGTITLTDTAYLRPRRSAWVVWEG